MKIALITTGGTIAMAREVGDNISSLSLDASYFAKELPLARDDEIILVNFSKVPSSNLDTAYARRLADKIEEIQESVEGVMITHGTDTMEETAFYLEMVVRNKIPVVLTGAMMTSGQPGYDGISNLISVIKTLKDPRSASKGVLIVFNRDIISAVHASKIQSERPDAFGSLQTGKIGSISGNRVLYYYEPVEHAKLSNKPGGRVALIKLHYDIEPDVFEASANRVDAIVVETLGSGRVPPKLLPAIDAILKENKLVILTTRVFGGHLYDEYAYDGSYQFFTNKKAIFSPLNSLKSALLAKLCCGNDMTFQETKEMFEGFF